MNPAIAQLGVVKLCFLGPFPGEFLNTLDFLPAFFRFLNLIVDRLGGRWIAVEEIVELLSQEVADVVADGLAIRCHFL